MKSHIIIKIYCLWITLYFFKNNLHFNKQRYFIAKRKNLVYFSMIKINFVINLKEICYSLRSVTFANDASFDLLCSIYFSIHNTEILESEINKTIQYFVYISVVFYNFYSAFLCQVFFNCIVKWVIKCIIKLSEFFT